MVLTIQSDLFGDPPSDSVRRQEIYSIDPSAFTSQNPDVDDIQHTSFIVNVQGGTVDLFAPIYLPQGATIVSAIVYGDANASAHTWDIDRININAAATSNNIGGNFVNSADTALNNQFAIVDNLLYTLLMRINQLDTSGNIYGASIVYQL